MASRAKQAVLALLILVVRDGISNNLAKCQMLLDSQAALAQKVRYATCNQTVFTFEKFCDRRHDGLCSQPGLTGSKG